MAVPVLPVSVPVTVWGPLVVAVQEAAVQEPSGAIVKVVVAGDVAERVVVLVEALRGVGLRRSDGDQRGRGREHEMVERPCRDAQRRRCSSCPRWCR